MLLRKICRNYWRSPITIGAVFFIAVSAYGLDRAAASDVLTRGVNSPFSSDTAALSDDVLRDFRGLGVDTSPSLGTGPQQRLSVILWDDLKRQQGQGSGGVVGNTAIIVSTAQ